jgi:NAD(P)-dependent dehydrogenase (short-subunit alcohol dehydrogenase family)
MDRLITPFGFTSTTAEVTAGIDLSGRRAIVTGGAAGIGKETSWALAQIGADVTLAVRNVERAAPAVADIISSTGNANVRAARLDLVDRSTIESFVTSWDGPLHLLVNNAGIMALPHLEKTPEGFEVQFATNHLGHFALALGLYPALAAAGDARIVALSSSGHLFSPVLFDDPHFNFIPYDPLVAYGQSKTATALFAVEATRRWSKDGIFTNSVMPGAIATNLQRHTGGLRTPAEKRKTPDQGAATTMLAAVSPILEGVGGRYLEDCNEAETVDHRTADYRGVAPYALNPENARRLWEMSEAMLSSSVAVFR